MIIPGIPWEAGKKETLSGGKTSSSVNGRGFLCGKADGPQRPSLCTHHILSSGAYKGPYEKRVTQGAQPPPPHPGATPQ